MKKIAGRLASNRLTMAAFALVAAGTLLSYNRPEVSIAALVIPLALLAVNLGAAIALRPALRQGGLGLFHLCLLAGLLLVAWGRLTHLDGRVEVVQEAEFDPAQVEVTAQGPWHGAAWRQLRFMQGRWDVGYAPGVRREKTRSEVWLPGERTPRTVGDDTPLVLDGYRFYTTSNKGFAPILSWQPDGGEALTGALHLPSYPLQEWNQQNRWVSPAGHQVKFWLRIEQKIPEDRPWRLAAETVPATLVLEVQGQRHELKPGHSLRLGAATLRYEKLSGWMGYRIFHDPTLMPLLIVSLAGIAGLAWHLWGRSARLLPLGEGAPA